MKITKDQLLKILKGEREKYKIFERIEFDVDNLLINRSKQTAYDEMIKIVELFDEVGEDHDEDRQQI